MSFGIKKKNKADMSFSSKYDDESAGAILLEDNLIKKIDSPQDKKTTPSPSPKNSTPDNMSSNSLIQSLSANNQRNIRRSFVLNSLQST